MFKNISIYRLDLPDDATESRDQLITAWNSQLGGEIAIGRLKQHFLTLPAPWTDIVHCNGQHALLRFRTEQRVIPPSVVAKGMKASLNFYRERHGRFPGKRVRQQLKEEVLFDLMARAFVKESYTLALIDWGRGLILFDSASARLCEELIGVLREAAGSLNATPVLPNTGSQTIMTHWVRAPGMIAKGFEIGTSLELENPLASSTKVRIDEHDLDNDEVFAHIDDGMVVGRVALKFHNRLSFILDTGLTIRRFKYTDVMAAEADRAFDGTSAVSPADLVAQKLDSDITLFALESSALIDELRVIFRFE